MLDLASIDLAALGEALEDHSGEDDWCLHPETGEVLFVHEDADLDVDPDDLIPIQPIASAVSYGDMAEFVELVPDRRARDLLARAIEGRGAFRRFKDTLFEFPDLRSAWFAFHDARMRRRALQWLVDHGLVDADEADKAAEAIVEPHVGDGVVDVAQVARDAKAMLTDLYGDRLTDVLMFGSYARGDATEESDLDLLIVLDRLDDPWHELRRVDPILWDLTERSGITVSGFPVSARELESPITPVLIRACADAQPVR